MPAASSFVDGECMTYDINLDLANEHLHWNPYPEDRDARQEALWSRRSESPPQPPQKEHRLRSAIDRAKFYARRLVEYHDGRVYLDAENPGQNAMNPQYWCARAGFYKTESDRLQGEDDNRSSRSVTPGFVSPDLFGATELDEAKGHAENAAFRLASLPAGKDFLDAEDHGEAATDPKYWRNKEKVYKNLYDIFPKESSLERAMRHAGTNFKKLATFPESEALLGAEHYGASASDPKYWQRKERYYQTEYKRLQQEFWDRWEYKHFGRGRPSSAVSSPFMMLSERQDALTSKKRTSCRSMAKEGNVTRETRSTAQHRNSPDDGSVAATVISGTDFPEAEYRRRRSQRLKLKSKPVLSVQPSPKYSPNGLATPIYESSKADRASINQDRFVRSPRVAKRPSRPGPKSKSRSRTGYQTPDSLESIKATVRSPDRRKTTTRISRLPEKNRLDRSLRSMSQPLGPISSRLRSSDRGLHRGEI